MATLTGLLRQPDQAPRPCTSHCRVPVAGLLGTTAAPFPCRQIGSRHRRIRPPRELRPVPYSRLAVRSFSVPPPPRDGEHTVAPDTIVRAYRRAVVLARTQPIGFHPAGHPLARLRATCQPPLAKASRHAGWRRPASAVPYL